jgi:hypothetical protein
MFTALTIYQAEERACMVAGVVQASIAAIPSRGAGRAIISHFNFCAILLNDGRERWRSDISPGCLQQHSLVEH